LLKKTIGLEGVGLFMDRVAKENKDAIDSVWRKLEWRGFFMHSSQDLFPAYFCTKREEYLMTGGC